MFRVKRGVHQDYNRQGYIYFVSRNYRNLPEKMKKRIRELCDEAGGEYANAVMRFVTTDETATKIEMEYYCSRATLYRAVRKYYRIFDL